MYNSIVKSNNEICKECIFHIAYENHCSLGCNNPKLYPLIDKDGKISPVPFCPKFKDINKDN